MKKFELTYSDIYHKDNFNINNIKQKVKKNKSKVNIINQTRAEQSLKFGLNIKQNGYNIYMSGLTGTGRFTTAKRFVADMANKMSPPADWCYVYNFKDNDQPIALSLDAGSGNSFADDMNEFIEHLQHEFPKLFDSEEYENLKKKVLKNFDNKRDKIFRKMNILAQEFGFSIQYSNTGLILVPMKDGNPISKENYEHLSKKEKQDIEKHRSNLHKKLSKYLKDINIFERSIKKEMKNLDKKFVSQLLNSLIDELKSKYNKYKKIIKYLDSIKEDILHNISDFKFKDDQMQMPIPGLKLPLPGPSFSRYKVNVIVDNSDVKGAPVIIESNPTYYNLLGRLEYLPSFGSMSTDFTMIKPGSILKANGGFLILHIEDVLKNFMAWDVLIRTIRNKSICIEDINEQYQIIKTASLKPEAIPLNIKVILIGPPLFYYLLYRYDAYFKKYFKIKADFDYEMKKNITNIKNYIGFINSQQKESKLKSFSNKAIEEIINYSSRLVSANKKLSTRFGDIVDILNESNYWADIDNKKRIDHISVKKAIDERYFRSNIIEEKILEHIRNKTILLDIKGEKIGQINGLSVLNVGNVSFGKPTKITATTYIGKNGVVNIDRESNLSGQIHSKGVLILSGLIQHLFGRNKPLSFGASLVFEQMYSEVDGDSASCAELIAILSSLAEIPIRQYIAVTGSINQFGELQPIGGVNEKIEGFYKVCKLRGLNGKQGVIIPTKNIDNLVLHDDVLNAVKENTFHIYTVKLFYEAIEILTGVSAGKKLPSGNFTKNSFLYKVDNTLEEFINSTIKYSNKKTND